MTIRRKNRVHKWRNVFAFAVSFSTIYKLPLTKSFTITISNGRSKAAHRINDLENGIDVQTSVKHRSCSQPNYLSAQKQRSYSPCEDVDNQDSDMDEGRREAMFSMIGTAWSLGGIIPAAALTSYYVEPANAAYGEDAKIVLPNAFEGISNRVNKQCLVESLGNRECLLYLDPANKLYQGADTQILLARLEKASVALASIPALSEQKKWSQVLGVTTGPMGSLSDTLTQLIKLTENKEDAKKIAQLVKTDVINIGQAAQRKEGKDIAQMCLAAEKHLAEFVSSL